MCQMCDMLGNLDALYYSIGAFIPSCSSPLHLLAGEDISNNIDCISTCFNGVCYRVSSY